MKYVGSKRRLAKHLAPILLDELKDCTTYVEPFVGGGNMIEHMPNPRIANDSNRYIVSALKALSEGWSPEDHLGLYMSSEQYDFVKADYLAGGDGYSDAVKGFVGNCMTFGSKFFGTYARSSKYEAENRSYLLEGINSARKQAPKLTGILWHVGDYRSFPIPANSLIYCDPPYLNTTGYKGHRNLDYDEFYEWCETHVDSGNKVFVSEITAPAHWDVVFEKEVTYTTGSIKGCVKTERLFRVRRK